MAERHNPHNGRDVDGRFRVRQADVDDVLEDPDGADLIRDDIRLGGAVADTGAQAGGNAQHIGDLIADNRDDVGRVTGANDKSSGRGRRGRTR